jgi:hypothetical protein
MLDLGGVNDFMFLLPPYMCAWYMLLCWEFYFSPNLWGKNLLLQASDILIVLSKVLLAGSDYFSQNLPRGEIVRFLGCWLYFSKISLSPRCGAKCAYIRIHTWTPWKHAMFVIFSCDIFWRFVQKTNSRQLACQDTLILGSAERKFNVLLVP